jgi:tRNA-splicing ligase RtcB
MPRVITETPTPIHIWASDLEAAAERQVRNVATLPFLHAHVAVMPDAHAGAGSTIGTVIATDGAILPAAVGVDIGCGMCALRFPLHVDQLGDNVQALRHSIERSVPTGRAEHRQVTDRAARACAALGLPPSIPQENKLVRHARMQLGTLGEGNHFIEICTDTTQQVWLLLHSGSRHIGKALADKHIAKAKGLMRERLASLPDPDLAYLVETMPEFHAYIQVSCGRSSMRKRTVMRWCYGSSKMSPITSFRMPACSRPCRRCSVWIATTTIASARPTSRKPCG